ncbi:MAG: large conductance mechanosensitive channel protein MscL [Clostridia bacterium]|nr:large conductance mechanosensitive channel protein MscL [Bacilli bacterium]MBR3720344.1 large conductance mechanosensitive channel protein MscL [Clostridia bacterium]
MSKDERISKLKDKGKGFFSEFKDFVMRGNVMDMAIGVIIGGAFSGIVTALTDDFINPLINGIGGAEVGGTIKIYGGQVIKYGDFITAVINFLIMALVLFMLLKFVNKLTSVGKKRKEEEVVPKSDEVLLLEEIRDLLKKQNKK